MKNLDRHSYGKFLIEVEQNCENGHSRNVARMEVDDLMFATILANLLQKYFNELQMHQNVEDEFSWSVTTFNVRLRHVREWKEEK